MEIQICEFRGNDKRVVAGGFPSLAEAKAYAEVNFNILFMEDDADYADCADLLTKSGMVFAIQPLGFKNNR